MKAKVFAAVIIILAIIIGKLGYSAGSNSGYKKGFIEAEAIGVQKNIDTTKAILEGCAEDTSHSYDQGKEAAEFSCEQEKGILQDLCNEHIEHAYQVGQVSGMKRVGKACGIKIK